MSPPEQTAQDEENLTGLTRNLWRLRRSPAAKRQRDAPSALFLALLLTGAYLAGPAWARLDTATAVLVLLHLALGLIAGPVFVWRGLRLWAERWRRSRNQPPPSGESLDRCRTGLFAG